MELKNQKSQSNQLKRAVVYARYSSDAQTEQSIEGQLRVCQEYAARNDIIILGTYIASILCIHNFRRFISFF